MTAAELIQRIFGRLECSIGTNHCERCHSVYDGDPERHICDFGRRWVLIAECLDCGRRREVKVNGQCAVCGSRSTTNTFPLCVDWNTS